MNKNFIKENAENLETSKPINPEASFNKPKFITPSLKKYYVEDRELIITENLSAKELSKLLPKVNLPKINTIIPPVNKKIEIKSNVSKKVDNLQPDKALNFTIDYKNQIVKFSNGKEFLLDTLTDINSKKGYSIDKDTAMEIANDYLKLAIPSKNKKSVFIKAIRETIGLAPE